MPGKKNKSISEDIEYLDCKLGLDVLEMIKRQSDINSLIYEMCRMDAAMFEPYENIVGKEISFSENVQK